MKYKLKKTLSILFSLFILLNITSCDDIKNNKNNLETFINNINSEGCSFEYVKQVDYGQFGKIQESFILKDNIIFKDYDSENGDYYQELVADKIYEYRDMKEYWEKREVKYSLMSDEFDPRNIKESDFTIKDSVYILNDSLLASTSYPFESLKLTINENNDGAIFDGERIEGSMLLKYKVIIRKYNQFNIELPTNIGEDIYQKYQNELKSIYLTSKISSIIKVGNKNLYKIYSDYHGIDPLYIIINDERIEEVKFIDVLMGPSDLTKRIKNSGFLNKFKNSELNYYIDDTQIKNEVGLEDECDSIKQCVNAVIYAETQIVNKKN